MIVPNEEYDSLPSTCNTKKNHGNRQLRYTAGIFLGIYPCGHIPLFAQLFGTENISQVYGILCDFYWLPAGQKPVNNRPMFLLLLLLKMVLPS